MIPPPDTPPATPPPPEMMMLLLFPGDEASTKGCRMAGDAMIVEFRLVIVEELDDDSS